jgi:hypothetical protein
MPIFTYKCPCCGKVNEILVIGKELEYYCTCGSDNPKLVTRMVKVPSVPSPPQWNCKKF